MTVLAKENVFWFQVAVDNSLLVEVFDGEDYFSRVEDDFLLCEPRLLIKMVEKRTTAFKVKQKVQTCLALKRVVESQYEWMLHTHQYLSLQLDVVKIVLLFKNGLVKHFHGVVSASTLFLLLNEEDLCKRAFAEGTNDSDGAKISLTAEVPDGIWTTGLNNIVVQRDSFLFLAIVRAN